MKRFVLFAMLLVSFAFAAVEEDIRSIVSEGNRLHDSGKYDAAIAEYKKALKLDSKNSLVLYEMAYSYYAKKDFKSAKEYGNKALKANKEQRLYGAICSMLGSIYDDGGQPDSALAVYRYGAEKDTVSYLLPFNVGVTLGRMKQLDSARAWFFKSSKLHKTHEGSHLNLWDVSRKNGNWMDFYAYAMYHIFISRKQELESLALNTLYGVSKGLAERVTDKDGKMTFNVSIPRGAREFEADQAFIMVLGLAVASDSVGEHLLYEPDTTNEQKAEFLIEISQEALQLLTSYDKKYYDSPILGFYKELKKEKLEDAFIHMIYANVDRSVFAKWRLENEKDAKRLYKWFNESYLGIKPRNQK